MLSLGICAQVAEAWVTMPDSICPYLTQQQRYYLLQNATNGTMDTIDNVLGGKTVVDSVNLKSNYLSVQMTANMNWKLYLAFDYDKTTQSTVKYLCLESTVCAPRCSTFKRYYDFAWNLMFSRHEPFVIEQTDEEKEQLF